MFYLRKSQLKHLIQYTAFFIIFRMILAFLFSNSVKTKVLSNVQI